MRRPIGWVSVPTLGSLVVRFLATLASGKVVWPNPAEPNARTKTFEDSRKVFILSFGPQSGVGAHTAMLNVMNVEIVTVTLALFPS